MINDSIVYPAKKTNPENHNSPENKPPVCNTGVVNTRLYSGTNDLANRLTVDWVEFTLDCTVDWSEWPKRFEATYQIDPVLAPRGLHGYRNQYKIGRMIVLTNGTAEMGHHVIMGGECLRDLAIDPVLLLGMVREFGGKITRLDLALDDYQQHITMDRMLACLRDGRLVCKSRKYQLVESGLLDNSAEVGRTLYVGSGKSTVMWRIYEKARQLRQAKKTETTLDWLRWEVQIRADRAAIVAEQIFAEQSLAVVYAALLGGYISIRDKSDDDSNRSRWAVSELWKRFVGLVAQWRWGFDKPAKMLIDKVRWFQRQIAPTFACILRAFGTDEMTRLFKEGDRRLRAEHWQMITLAKM